MEELLPFGLKVADALAVFVGLAAFISVYAVWQATLVRDPMRGRIKSLESRREALRAGYIAPRKRRIAVRRLDSVSYMRQVVSKLNLLGADQTWRNDSMTTMQLGGTVTGAINQSTQQLANLSLRGTGSSGSSSGTETIVIRNQ